MRFISRLRHLNEDVHRSVGICFVYSVEIEPFTKPVMVSGFRYLHAGLWGHKTFAEDGICYMGTILKVSKTMPEDISDGSGYPYVDS